MRNPIECLPLPRLYYQSENSRYIRSDANGNWIQITEENAKRYLVEQGYHRSLPKNQPEIDQCLMKIQATQNIAYFGPLAGFMAGPHTLNGKNILVSDSPRLIAPINGTWLTLKGVFEAVLMLETPGQETDQLDCFYSWLAAGYEAIKNSKPSQAQVLVLAGPAGAGKSLIQQIITELFGGRSGRPYQAMSGNSKFNSELFGAEHLVMEDENESTRIEERQSFGSSIKSYAVNHGHRHHAKGKDAMILTPVWRVTVSINDTSERLKVLPPLESDIADKLIILQAYRRELPMPTASLEEKEAFWKKLVEELPAFIDFLMKRSTDAPGTDRNRYGVVSYHNPDLLAKINSATPESQLLELIDLKYYSVPRETLSGSAFEIMDELGEHPFISNDIKQLVKSPEVMGKYLSRLAEKEEYQGRVTKVEGAQRRTNYTIQPPPTKTTPPRIKPTTTQS